MLWAGWKTAAVIPVSYPEIIQLGEELQQASKYSQYVLWTGGEENALFKCLERYNHDLGRFWRLLTRIRFTG